MAPVWVFLIVFAVILIIGIILYFATNFEGTGLAFILIAGTVAFVCLIVGILQVVILKQEAIEYRNEREQIVYQIENMTEDTDKIKLNEWILTYNDWVNEVNSDKEAFGWFSWYWSFDMSEHTIINLV